MHKPSLKSLIGATAAAVAISFTVPAVAQTQTQQQHAQAQITEDDLRAYAAAAVEVLRISNEWEPRIQAAPDEEASMGLRQQAQAEMIDAVEAEGLTVEQYTQIFQMAQNDPTLQQQVQEYMEQAR